MDLRHVQGVFLPLGSTASLKDLFSSNIDSTVLLTLQTAPELKTTGLVLCVLAKMVFLVVLINVQTHIQMCMQAQTRKNKQL